MSFLFIFLGWLVGTGTTYNKDAFKGTGSVNDRCFTIAYHGTCKMLADKICNEGFEYVCLLLFFF